MSMTPESAVIVRNQLLGELAHETKTTLEVIRAVPEGQEGYTPHAKSMNGLMLAWHIASAEWWFLSAILTGKFPEGAEPGVPAGIKTSADVLAWHQANVPGLIDQVREMQGADLLRVLDMFGMVQMPAVNFLSLALRHTIHHRGQLSTYLRPMGAKVPGIYGPSGDTADSATA